MGVPLEASAHVREVAQLGLRGARRAQFRALTPRRWQRGLGARQLLAGGDCAPRGRRAGSRRAPLAEIPWRSRTPRACRSTRAAPAFTSAPTVDGSSTVWWSTASNASSTPGCSSTRSGPGAMLTLEENGPRAPSCAPAQYLQPHHPDFAPRLIGPEPRQVQTLVEHVPSTRSGAPRAGRSSGACSPARAQHLDVLRDHRTPPVDKSTSSTRRSVPVRMAAFRRDLHPQDNAHQSETPPQ